MDEARLAGTMHAIQEVNRGDGVYVGGKRYEIYPEVVKCASDGHVCAAGVTSALDVIGGRRLTDHFAEHVRAIFGGTKATIHEVGVAVESLTFPIDVCVKLSEPKNGRRLTDPEFSPLVLCCCVADLDLVPAQRLSGAVSAGDQLRHER